MRDRHGQTIALNTMFWRGACHATSAYAKGGIHMSEPHPVHPDRHKTPGWAPVIVYPPGHYRPTCPRNYWKCQF